MATFSARQISALNSGNRGQSSLRHAASGSQSANNCAQLHFAE